MKFCPYCGTKLVTEDAVFCHECGRSTRETPKAEPLQVMPARAKRRGLPRGKLAVGIILVLLVISALAGGVGFFAPGPSPPTYLTTTNVTATATRTRTSITPTTVTTATIDPTIRSSNPELPGIKRGLPRQVGVIVGPDGTRDEYVMNEVTFHPRDLDELQAFLTRYDGKVLRDGTPLIIPGVETKRALPPRESSGWYLVQVNLDRSPLEDLANNMGALNLLGHIVFSSNDAARLVALVARERVSEKNISPNFVMEIPSWEHSWEHPTSGGGHLDAATWWYMTEDDDPKTPGDQGLSVGVIHAWQYVNYQGLPPPPPAGGFWTPSVVAMVDAGFDLDETTGVPNNQNIDYFYRGDKPWQVDVVDWDGTAGGIAPIKGKEWHGQGAFGVALAWPGNGFGTAGTAGETSYPMLIKVDLSLDGLANAVTTAVYNNADVVNMSFGVECGWACRNFSGGDSLEHAISNAVNWGVVPVVPAGNDGKDISKTDFYPCTIKGVICVGSIDRNRMRESYSNFGSSVDIWAPDCTHSTVGRGQVGKLGFDALWTFCGTCGASAFVSGIVGMMKVLNPYLASDQVRMILQTTANDSPDPDVTPGYVDAYRAVLQARPNQPPTAKIVNPSNGDSISYSGLFSYTAQVNDPDPGADQTAVKVVWSSDRQGQLCAGTACRGPELGLGIHVITATATDPFGAMGSDSITVNVINHPPSAIIGEPPSGSSFRSNQVINFKGYAEDPDDLMAPLCSACVLAWSSSINGALGTGGHITVSLSEGVHTITLTATDPLGLTATTSITVNVLAGAGYPSGKIISPATGTSVTPGTPITFKGEGTDPEDGVLSGSSLKWYSDRDGFLGTGNTITVVLSGPQTPCSPDKVTHTITLIITDSDGHQVQYTIQVNVGTLC